MKQAFMSTHAEEHAEPSVSELHDSVVECIENMAENLDAAAISLVAEITVLTNRLKARTAELEETRRLLDIARRYQKEVIACREK